MAQVQAFDESGALFGAHTVDTGKVNQSDLPVWMTRVTGGRNLAAGAAAAPAAL